jgi:MoaA/NifB/PqqE/SkfB family radical SAM enzyme
MAERGLARLKDLTIKPSLACTANCPGCASRRELHRAARSQRHLSLRGWLEVLGAGRSLGAETLTISGGEPTLYEELPALVRGARDLGYQVYLNTNGGRVEAGLAGRLVAAGLGAVRVSIYSHQEPVHDAARRSNGLFAKACAAVRAFVNLRRECGAPLVWTQSVILRENIRSLDELMRFHRELGSESWLVSYLEGDFEHRLLVSEDDIRAFRKETLPRILGYCRTLDQSVRETARARLAGLYDPLLAPARDFSNGLYPSGSRCELPSRHALILANGDVHPCPVVEYTHGPVAGSLFRESLPEIWRSEAWERFRRSLHEKCGRCPAGLHQTIPLAGPAPRFGAAGQRGE